MTCTCEEASPTEMKWDENCPEHGSLAQSFEKERQYYLLKIEATRQYISPTAFGGMVAVAYLIGIIVAVLVMRFGGG